MEFTEILKQIALWVVGIIIFIAILKIVWILAKALFFILLIAGVVGLIIWLFNKIFKKKPKEPKIEIIQ